MDSLAIWHILHPEPTRAEADAWLARAMTTIAAAVPPSRLYDDATLALWATQRGYRRADDTDALVALLNRAAEFVPAHTPTRAALMDAIYRFGGRNPTT